MENLAKEFRINLRVMLILNFHKQLRKAFRRDVLRWTAARDFELETRDREKIVDYCVWGVGSGEWAGTSGVTIKCEYEPTPQGLI